MGRFGDKPSLFFWGDSCMETLTTILCGLAMFGGQGAPVDVPRSHWAFSAVDEMFREGLLVGYPAGSLRLDRKLAFDQKFADQCWKRWEVKSEWFRHGLPNGYALAAFTTVVYEQYLQGQRGMEVRDISVLVRAISSVALELEKLGMDPEKMVRDLNRIWKPDEVSFRG